MMDEKHFLMFSEIFENFRIQAIKLMKEAEEFGFIDDLTGCYNRKAYNIRKEQIRTVDCGVVFIDVNGLKTVNDTQGHRAGDMMLKDLGKMLKAYFGGNDTFRIGGDEFVILKPKVKQEVFMTMIDDFTFSINALHKTTVAIGYSMSDDDKPLDTAIKEAESEMYYNKKNFYKNSRKI